MEKQKKKVSQTKGKAKPQGGVAKKFLKRKFDEVFKEDNRLQKKASVFKNQHHQHPAVTTLFWLVSSTKEKFNL